jgi:hypothetical protein
LHNAMGSTLTHMTKRPSAPRQLSRADTAAARVLAAPSDRTVRADAVSLRDELEAVHARQIELLRSLIAEAKAITSHQAPRQGEP